MVKLSVVWNLFKKIKGEEYIAKMEMVNIRAFVNYCILMKIVKGKHCYYENPSIIKEND